MKYIENMENIGLTALNKHLNNYLDKDILAIIYVNDKPFEIHRNDYVVEFGKYYIYVAKDNRTLDVINGENANCILLPCSLFDQLSYLKLIKQVRNKNTCYQFA